VWFSTRFRLWHSSCSCIIILWALSRYRCPKKNLPTQHDCLFLNNIRSHYSLEHYRQCRKGRVERQLARMGNVLRLIASCLSHGQQECMYLKFLGQSGDVLHEHEWSGFRWRIQGSAHCQRSALFSGRICYGVHIAGTGTWSARDRMGREGTVATKIKGKYYNEAMKIVRLLGCSII